MVASHFVINNSYILQAYLCVGKGNESEEKKFTVGRPVWPVTVATTSSILSISELSFLLFANATKKQIRYFRL